VRVPDGQTIILGSVPQHGKSNKELLIIVTPHIIRAEDAKPAR
jgi:Flp pilus assembly secretin CpaC